MGQGVLQLEARQGDTRRSMPGQPESRAQTVLRLMRPLLCCQACTSTGQTLAHDGQLLQQLEAQQHSLKTSMPAQPKSRAWIALRLKCPMPVRPAPAAPGRPARLEQRAP